MKVLFLVHDTVISGAALSLFNLLEGLKAKGVDVYLAGPSVQGNYKERLKKIGAKYYDVHPVLSIMPPKRTLRNKVGFLKNYINLLIAKRKYYSELIKIADLIRPDLIHTNVGVLHEGLKVANKYRIPHIIHLREYQDLDFKWNFYPSKKRFEEMLRTTNVICISEDIKRYFELSDYPFCQTIYNGILHKNEATYCSKKESYFMTASRISPEKEIATTIKSFSLFSSKYGNYILRIFGDGADIYKKQLKELVSELRLDDKVIFEGYKSNIPYYLERATALIVSSSNEGFGRMSAEALMKGCALIGRNSGGTKEIMNAVPSFPFDDEQGCASQMSNVVELQKRRDDSRLVLSQKKAIALFSVEQNLDKIYSLYLKLLSRSNVI